MLIDNFKNTIIKDLKIGLKDWYEYDGYLDHYNFNYDDLDDIKEEFDDYLITRLRNGSLFNKTSMDYERYMVITEEDKKDIEEYLKSKSKKELMIEIYQAKLY